MFSRVGRNATLGSLLFVVVFAISAGALYAGAQLVKTESTSQADGGDVDIPPGPVTVTIVSRNIQFDKRTITANAGESLTVIHDNQDAGVLHNIAFYTNRSASQSIFVGQVFAGPRIVEETFTAPAIGGSFFYRCDVHPDTMTGTLVVR